MLGQAIWDFTSNGKYRKLLIIRNINRYGLGVGIRMVSEIFRTLRIGKAWACL